MANLSDNCPPISINSHDYGIEASANVVAGRPNPFDKLTFGSYPTIS
jgi:hypothetical protein